jgi:NitT/TauT family transport system permease protein
VVRVVVERHQTLWNAFCITALEAGGGYLLSIVGGVVIALFFAQSPLIRRSLYPYTILLQTVPIVAIAPLILMWFGSGLRSVMLVAFVICLFPIIANTTQGLISVPRNLIDLFIMSNASRSRLLLKLRLPHALPHLFVGLRISAGISVIGAVTGELFASSNAVGEGGLGYSITYANSQLQTDYLFALVLTASLLGFLFFFTVTALEWLCLRKWHESAMKIDAD